MIVRSPMLGSIVRSPMLSDLVSSPMGGGAGTVSVTDGLSPAIIAIYTAGGILMAGLGFYALGRKKKRV